MASKIGVTRRMATTGQGVLEIAPAAPAGGSVWRRAEPEARRSTEDADHRLEELIERHARVIGAAIRRVCGRRHASWVPDIEQELRLALWKRLKRGGKIDHPVAYLHRAAMTTALTVLRRQAAERECATPDATLEAECPIESPREMARVEESRLLEQLLEELPSDNARALRAYLAGFNHVEVARLYGWTESTARHRIYRGVERLRKVFGKSGGGEND